MLLLLLLLLFSSACDSCLNVFLLVCFLSNIVMLSCGRKTFHICL